MSRKGGREFCLIGVLMLAMNAERNSDRENRPHPKAMWLAMWLIIFGGLTFAVLKYWFNDNLEPVDNNNVSLVEITSSFGPLPVFAKPVLENETDFAPEINADKVDFEKLMEPHRQIEDPDGRALAFFNRSLKELALGKRKEPVRIIHYGDSILTTDQLSGRIRYVLQKNFGDAGHGFVLMGQPWRWYSHLDVIHGAKGKWRPRPFTSDPLADGLYGLGGVAFQAKRGSRGRAWAGTSDEGEIGRIVENFDLSYLEQPGGGSFELTCNDKKVETISTKADVKRVVHKQIKVSRGAGKIEVKYNNDGRLRLFGVTLESGIPGIVYDSLAINGARAAALDRFDTKHWISELKHRNPALVIIMFGANEGANRFLALKEYKVHLTQILQTLKAGLPQTSIMIIGPLDQAKRNPDKTFASKRMPIRLSKVQRKVALENNCAFFDTWTAMGGKGSMGNWFRRGLGGGDMIHPTKHGAGKIGNWVAEALLYEYQRYLHNLSLE